jgi:hypothetical protein
MRISGYSAGYIGLTILLIALFTPLPLDKMKQGHDRARLLLLYSVNVDSIDA